VVKMKPRLRLLSPPIRSTINTIWMEMIQRCEAQQPPRQSPGFAAGRSFDDGDDLVVLDSE